MGMRYRVEVLAGSHWAVDKHECRLVLVTECPSVILVSRTFTYKVF